jgi:hypothetical protein
MLQSDIFPFEPFSVIDMLEGNSLLYRDEFRESDTKNYIMHYAWDGFLMFDFKADPLIDSSLWKTFSFDDMFQRGDVFTDTGGGSWYILEKLQKKKKIECKMSLKWLNSDPILKTFPEPIQQFINTDVRNDENKMFSEIKHKSFIHLSGGGNWEFHTEIILQQQQERFNKFIYTIKELLTL